MSRLLKLFALCCLAVFAQGVIVGAPAQTIDPHKLYEQRCGGCHTPHAGDFVHNSIVGSRGYVYGRKSGKELRTLLESGHGNLTVSELVSMVTHLTSIQNSGRLFYNKCKICHVRAVILARRELVLENGELTGRYTNRNIEQFLLGHGRLSADQVALMIDVLKRQLSTQEN